MTSHSEFYESTMTGRTAYRVAVGVALATALVLIWLSLGVGIIGADGDPANMMYFGVVGVGIVGALIARFRPCGMARALFAAALAQASVAAIALVTGMGEPYSGPLETMLLNGFFVAGFAASGVLFWRAGHDGRKHSSRSAPDSPSHLLLLIGFMAAAPLAHTPARAQDRTSEIDRIFSEVAPDMPGCAVALSQHGQVVSRAYGLADLDRDVPITPATIFDVGSIQKQFVAAAVLLLAEEGRISLSDDVQTYFPELPDYGRTITVDHLLTHTSGLRDWIGLSQMSIEDEKALTMILRQRGLNFAPGNEWSYSNSGYVLLKELIARTTGMSFSEFARRRLFELLGMESTSYAEDIRAAGEKGALAYEKEGEGWKPDVMLGDDRGGGAVLSTAEDLLVWNEALTSARFGSFVTETIQEPARLNNGRDLDYARGLFLDDARGSEVVWHTGSAGGYKSMLARFPEHGLSLAILCNGGEGADRSRFARRIVDLYVPAADVSPDDVHAVEDPETAGRAPDPEAVTGGAEAIDVAGRQGLFFSEAGREPMYLVAHDGKLRIPGGPVLETVSEDRFRNPSGELDFMSGDEFELHFRSADEFTLTSMEGETTRYRRTQPFAPTAAELLAYTGRYESDEMRAVLELAPEGNGLAIRLNGSQGFEFAPVHPDIFQRGRMMLRFRRNEEGNVVALEYSNPVIRKITFTRLSEGIGGR